MAMTCAGRSILNSSLNCDCLLLQADSTMEYIPTRMTKVSTPKPAANPLQFVKVGPCDLFKSAQETLKKVEEVKKMKREVRDEAEEWQSVSCNSSNLPSNLL